MIDEAFGLLETQWREERDQLGPDAFEEFKAVQLKLQILTTVRGELQTLMDTGTIVAHGRDSRLEIEQAIKDDVVQNG